MKKKVIVSRVRKCKMLEMLRKLVKELDVKNCASYSNCGVQSNPCPRVEFRALLNYIKNATEQGVDMESVCVEHLKNECIDRESRALIKAVLILIQKLKRTNASSDFHKQIINQILTSSSMSCIGKKC